MQTWPEQDAKAHFSELLETCVTDGPQLVTQHREALAVLVPITEWWRLTGTARPALKELLLTNEYRGDLQTPPRGKARHRNI